VRQRSDGLAPGRGSEDTIINRTNSRLPDNGEQLRCNAASLFFFCEWMQLLRKKYRKNDDRYG
jgi:hypothetical protein